jgi:hypothetical protein
VAETEVVRDGRAGPAGQVAQGIAEPGGIARMDEVENATAD